MKRVFDNRQCAHVWAQGNQNEGRSHNGNLFFEGSKIYSFGRHFCIARHVTTIAGESAILFTWRDYSVSTSQHKGFVRQAIPRGTPIFCVHNPEKEPADSLPDLRARRDSFLEKAAKPRIRQATKDGFLNQYQIMHEALNDFGAAFVEGYQAEPLPDDLEKRIAETKDRIEKAEKAEKERREKVRQEYEAELVAKNGPKEQWAERWKAGKGLDSECLSYLRNYFPIMLRAQEGEIVTTKGARFPLDHAKKAFAVLAKMVKPTDSGYAFAGTYDQGHKIKLGFYAIDSIAPNGTVKAGCHEILFAEIVDCAKRLGIA